ncbi:iron uptake system protein EfeO [Tabrizicola sp. J26]|uniref:iron uptake system protein EfeO n=1 Tax=Alitabrizicola rongguiensis TaxID=2909234 RepID=UPI001F441CC2|nr:iron uptake system protein EfeO [Tabrizicola rongguiensis]MCF1708278.1 iron uptake system protein EfeO [Tabrizicola rongguiensis]
MTASESQTPPLSRRAARLALIGSAALVVLGAGAVWWAASHAVPESIEGEITVTITDAACDPMTLTVPAGKSTFRIQNASNRVLEWEILDGVLVVAERENIAPGLNSTLTERLKPGTYDITCGLLSNPRGTLTVTPTAESEAAITAPELRAFVGPLAEYRVYLSRRASSLVKATASLSDRIAANDLDGARAAWIEAREPWRQMAPVAGRMGDLVNRMDPLAIYLQGQESDPAFTGFHRIEYGLWSQNSTDGLAPVALALAADAVDLQARIKALEVSPADLSANAADLARRVADQAAGGQTPYSQTDLAEFAADLDGITKSAMLVDPFVAAADPVTSAALHQAIEATQATLASFAVGGAYPSFTEVDSSGRKAISASFETLSTAIAALNPAIGLE